MSLPTPDASNVPGAPAVPGNARAVTLVTGAAARIGRAVALELAGHGHDLALHCRGSREQAEATAADCRALGARAVVLVADLADDAAVQALLPQAVAALGRVDAVVNNASLFSYDDARGAGPDLMDAHWRVNTAAPVRLAQALAPALRVLGVAPGVTLPSGPMTEAEHERARRMTPLGRSSTPEDIARAVRFALESPAITGTTLLVDGGQHLAGQSRDVLFLAQGQA